MPSPHPQNRKTVAIIGAGAAGYFAAITMAEADPEAQVQIYEVSRRTLTKVSISGGGRCNVTHHCFDPKELVTYYPRGGKELRGAFHKWQPRDTVDWFQSRGVSLKTEADGRMFPTTDDSQTIITCLTETAAKAGVQLHLRTGVSAIKIQSNETAAERTSKFQITLTNGETTTASHVIIATGGGQKNAGHALATSVGHTITDLAPSLFTFHIKHPLLEDLQGLSLPEVQVSFPPAKLQQSGPIVFTHWGLSGPGILKLSAWGARVFSELNYQCELSVNWYGGAKPDEIRSALEHSKQQNARKALVSLNPFDFPRRFWERMLAYVSISPDTQWAQLPKKNLNQLVESIANTRLQTNGKSMNKEEFVTCGGVKLKEVDFKTMQSRIVPNLYFAGEVLDIDGVTGGFNFQAAWTTSKLAAQAISADIPGTTI
ncbi:NAD(P)/FAD-dependent oxidoreductase [Pelagicoccus sp. SDUM812002]|uniref:NAD(P)/FAD-dependent oxidoreductase n=1 Tax=Pelagicoccus sp. SDUM812002 TaxID=3041266 RepID=UPI00280ED1DB|nr:NAD(P)/FAD-dependent oxidoreductase [Pelagicoccus sp. SDUM812002]MDQ8187272.1 NAD(P)/FAD-dependent oxidoreductase [Pelagicoccus sp. SDUM812002]